MVRVADGHDNDRHSGLGDGERRVHQPRLVEQSWLADSGQLHIGTGRHVLCLPVREGEHKQFRVRHGEHGVVHGVFVLLEHLRDVRSGTVRIPPDELHLMGHLGTAQGRGQRCDILEGNEAILI